MSQHEEDILSSQPVEHAVRSRPDDEKQHRDFTSASQRRRRLPKVARPPTPPLPTSHKRLRSQLDDMRSRSVSPEHVHHKLPVQPPLFRDPTTVMSPEGTLCGSDDDHQSKPFFRPACYRWSIRSSKCSMAGRSCASRAASMRMVCRRFARWGSTIRLKLNRILGLALPPAVVTY
ncbi:hypothetical protein K474DRAFT_1134520 [Panus rudis PR-1116 ss-1]|nr:hypothetical protein K474DRAFT_1134520 [Panus rudis PR-1116 ss-1]